MRKLLVGLLLLTIILSGCIETSGNTASSYNGQTQSGGTDTPVQSITGNYKDQEISGNIVRITGNYNKIKIINTDVSEIWVTGNYNTVYYPKEARPLIKEVGNENVIKTY